MDIVAALKYPIQGKGGLKTLLIGGLVFLVPILGQIIVLRYLVSVIQAVASGNEDQLPGWEDWRENIREGFVPALAILGYFVIVLIIASILSSTFSDRGGQASLCLLPILAALGIFLNVVLQVGLMRYAATDEARSFLAFRTNLSVLTKDTGTVLPTLVVNALGPYALSLVYGLLMFLICPIFLSPFVLFYTGLFIAHMLGRLSAKLDLGYKASVDADFWN